MNLNNHVVICNWNEKSYELVKKLHPKLYEQSENDWHTIVVVAQDIPSFPDHRAFKDTVLIPGDPGNRTLLDRANVLAAQTVIILPDLRKANPDDDVLRIALTIKDLLKGQEKNKNGRNGYTRVVAKIVDHNNASGFRKGSLTGIHEVICEGDLGLRVLAQTSITPGMTYVLKDLLDYSSKNSELYLTDVPKEWVEEKVELKSFQDLTTLVLDHEKSFPGVIAVGFFRPREDGGYDILINPRQDKFEESGIKSIEDGDKVLVLAVDSNSARRFLHHGPPVANPEASPTQY